MNRVEIKQEAKKILEDNIFNIWKPILVSMLFAFIYSLLLIYLGIDENHEYYLFYEFIFSLFTIPLSVGEVYYMLNLVRKKDYEVKNVFKFYGDFVFVVCVNLLIGIIVFSGTILLIIPGIIASLMFVMTNYIIADGSSGIINTLKRSKDMMKGYKSDYLMFCLSFSGWIILSLFTFGIALIYVVPYVIISQALYYDKLKQIKEKY